MRPRARRARAILRSRRQVNREQRRQADDAAFWARYFTEERGHIRALASYAGGVPYEGIIRPMTGHDLFLAHRYAPQLGALARDIWT